MLFSIRLIVCLQNTRFIQLVCESREGEGEVRSENALALRASRKLTK